VGNEVCKPHWKPNKECKVCAFIQVQIGVLMGTGEMAQASSL